MEELAIIKDIHVGMRDTHEPICWFTVDALSGSSLQLISVAEMVIHAQVYKLEDLNNKPCIVEVNNRTMKFKRVK